MADIYEETPPVTNDQLLSFGGSYGTDEVKISKYTFCTADVSAEYKAKAEIGADGESIEINSPVFVFGYEPSLTYLYSSELELGEGELFKAPGECVISKNENNTSPDMVSWNRLSLEDTVSLAVGDDRVDYKIVGIIAENKDESSKTNRRMIYTPLESAELFDKYLAKNLSLPASSTLEPEIFTPEASAGTMINLGYSAVAFLESPDLLFDINDRIIDSIPGFNIQLSPMHGDFAALTKLTETLASSSVLFIIAFAFIILIVTLITTFRLISERKYEIAVLRSVGMPKLRLVICYLIKNLAFVWGITIAAAAFSIIPARPAVGKVLDTIKQMVAPEIFTAISGFGGKVWFYSSVSVFLAMTAAAALTLIFTAVSILRFRPLEILIHRD